MKPESLENSALFKINSKSLKNILFFIAFRDLGSIIPHSFKKVIRKVYSLNLIPQNEDFKQALGIWINPLLEAGQIIPYFTYDLTELSNKILTAYDDLFFIFKVSEHISTLIKTIIIAKLSNNTDLTNLTNLFDQLTMSRFSLFSLITLDEMFLANLTELIIMKIQEKSEADLYYFFYTLERGLTGFGDLSLVSMRKCFLDYWKPNMENLIVVLEKFPITKVINEGTNRSIDGFFNFLNLCLSLMNLEHTGYDSIRTRIVDCLSKMTILSFMTKISGKVNLNYHVTCKAIVEFMNSQSLSIFTHYTESS